MNCSLRKLELGVHTAQGAKIVTGKDSQGAELQEHYTDGDWEADRGPLS